MELGQFNSAIRPAPMNTFLNTMRCRACMIAAAAFSLVVSPAPSTEAVQPLNLSTRMFVQTGDGVGIGGFIITGTGLKRVVLRAIGPSLTGLGIPNALADPVLELHGPSGFVTIINNDWADDPNQEALIFFAGLAPQSHLESAIHASWLPEVIPASSEAVGTAQVWPWLNSMTSTQAGPRSWAISPPAPSSSTGDNIVIAGFILGNGTGTDNLILRGIGPSLSGVGVPNVLANPTLELRNSSGALLVGNNNWQDNPVQATIIDAAGLAPGNPLESAIAATLPPGSYTALLAGLNNGTGNGLVEVYHLGDGTPFPSPTPGVTPTPTPPGITLDAHPPARNHTNANTARNHADTDPTSSHANPNSSTGGNLLRRISMASRSCPPGGWRRIAQSDPPPLWAISTTNPDTPPNDAFVSNTCSDQRQASGQRDPS